MYSNQLKASCKLDNCKLTGIVGYNLSPTEVKLVVIMTLCKKVETYFGLTYLQCVNTRLSVGALMRHACCTCPTAGGRRRKMVIEFIQVN